MSLHWSEEEYTRYVLRETGQPAPMPEGVWMQAVRRIAKEAGYTFQYHVFDSRRSVHGYPDLTLVHREPGHPLYMVELKTDVGQVTPAQQAWLTALAGTSGVVAECWRPAQLQEIIERLRG